jgi:hypothetical protein
MSPTAPWKSLWVTAAPGLGIKKQDIFSKQALRFLLISIFDRKVGITSVTFEDRNSVSFLENNHL